MEAMILMLMITVLLVIFTVDALQKRRKFLSESKWE